jgi:hypothetical protein
MQSFFRFRIEKIEFRKNFFWNLFSKDGAIKISRINQDILAKNSIIINEKRKLIDNKKLATILRIF